MRMVLSSQSDTSQHVLQKLGALTCSLPVAKVTAHRLQKIDFVLSFLHLPTNSNSNSPSMATAAADHRADPESEDELDSQTARPASSISERRRVQEAILDNWINSAAGQDAIYKAKDPKHTAADEEKSIHALMNEQYTEKIKHPRDYQIELFERAKNENTIAVLDTGSGKTLISALLLRWIIDQELENRVAGHYPKTSFFLTQSVTLAHQQFSVLENNLDHKVTLTHTRF